MKRLYLEESISSRVKPLSKSRRGFKREVVEEAKVQSDIVISLHSGQNNLEVKLEQEIQSGIFVFVLRISFDKVQGNQQTQTTAHQNLKIRQAHASKESKRKTNSLTSQ